MLKYLAIALLLSTAAFAETPPRQIDFSFALQDLMGPAEDCDGIDKDGKCNKSVPMTLGRLSAEALLIPDKSDTLGKQVEKGDLARQVWKGGKISLSIDEVKLIEDSLSKLGFHTVVIADALKELDPDYKAGK